ncbi:MAG: zinc ribbon domain-containing protein [Acidobacteria bacterium]|nr:zinc ribbon domain-containing protein [Acidobacteriota bacterium]
MEPEIARRCQTCGASVRGAARFCPQCGQAMADGRDVAESFETTHEQESVASSSAAEPVAPVNVPVIENAPSAGDGARTPAENVRADGRGAQTAPTKDAPPDSAPAAGEARAASAGDARAAGRVRRATAAVGAGLGESVRPRVEKLREASVVVFDEAAEDPGMRFVVIAALLFVVALLILLFSFVLR